MNRTEIEQKIKKIVARQLGMKMEQIESSAHLQKTLFADSLDILSIKIAIEDAFDIVFDDEELQDLLQLDAIMDIVEKKTI